GCLREGTRSTAASRSWPSSPFRDTSTFSIGGAAVTVDHGHLGRRAGDLSDKTPSTENRGLAVKVSNLPSTLQTVLAALTLTRICPSGRPRPGLDSFVRGGRCHDTGKDRLRSDAGTLPSHRGRGLGRVGRSPWLPGRD